MSGEDCFTACIFFSRCLWKNSRAQHSRPCVLKCCHNLIWVLQALGHHHHFCRVLASHKLYHKLVHTELTGLYSQALNYVTIHRFVQVYMTILTDSLLCDFLYILYRFFTKFVRGKYVFVLSNVVIFCVHQQQLVV